ncbi:MAG: hypothetical protein H6707_08670 [Deltaproteobacteria bacterium]|nr:hypothetical protein [Deltaproteobacteria bacterium]
MSRYLAVVFALALASLFVGCARQQWKFDTIDKRDRLRFAACRDDVRRAMCPDDPDCPAKAATLYAEERPDARLQWLLDYKCQREKIEHADRIYGDQERRRIGLPEK